MGRGTQAVCQPQPAYELRLTARPVPGTSPRAGPAGWAGRASPP